MAKQTVVILDFGGQYKELIARRVRECGVYSVIVPYDIPPAELAALSPAGIILTGGPDSVYRENAPVCDRSVFDMGIPVLGICYGMQLICRMLGGGVSRGESSEYGVIDAFLDIDSPLFYGLEREQRVLMSHTDMVRTLPLGFEPIAHTQNCPVAAVGNNELKIYGVQFHPEVENTKEGKAIINNFLYRV